MNPKLFHYFSYKDARNAIDWLCYAFGFEVIRRQLGENNTVQHAELKLGKVVVIVACSDAPYNVPSLQGRSTGQGVYILTNKVDEIYQQAVKLGVQTIFAPVDTEWGTRRCRVLDLEGYEWSFGTYEPGVFLSAERAGFEPAVAFTTAV